MGISHKWNGTVLTITSDSGTSSADLKGEKGDTGVRGAQGAKGRTGELNTDALVDYATKEDVSAAIANAQIPEATADLSAYWTITDTEQFLYDNFATALRATKYGNPLSVEDAVGSIEWSISSRNIIPSTVNTLSNWNNYSGKHYRFKLNVETGATYSFSALSDRNSNYSYLYIVELDKTNTMAQQFALYRNNTKLAAEVAFTTREGYSYHIYYYGETVDFEQYSSFNVIVGAGASEAYTDYEEDLTKAIVEVYTNGEAYGSYTPEASGVVYLPTVNNMSVEVVNMSVVIRAKYNRDISAAFEELRQAIISLGGNI